MGDLTAFRLGVEQMLKVYFDWAEKKSAENV